MRVLQINSVCGVGSTGRITTDLYKVLKDQGQECCIAYGRGTAPEHINAYRIGTDWDVYLHAFYTRITDRTAFASKRATRELIDKLTEYNPDVIHLHNLHGYYINLELLFQYLKEVDKPVIWSLYDCWSFTGHCCHFDYIGCDKWKQGCYSCEQQKEYPTSCFMDNSIKNYERKKTIIISINRMTIVPPTPWLSGLVKESFLSKFSSVIIPSGIDLEVFKPTASNLRKQYGLENKYVILGVSNGFSKFKGSHYFVELANQLPMEYQLILIGVSEEQKRLFPKNVLTLPRTNDVEELAQFYTMANVFLNPTLQETQGLTNIEALACGTGVVTFNSGGSPDCIDESCGLVVERDDFEGLKHAVMQACQCPFDSIACRRKASLYDKTILYDRYIDLYKKVQM